MWIALITVSILAVAEFVIIWQLINRVLTQAGQPPLQLPSLPTRSDDRPPDLPQSEQRRKIMSIPFMQ